MIRIVFIGNDQKSLTIIKMSISNINISLAPPDYELITFIKTSAPDIVLLDLDLGNNKSIQIIRKILKMTIPPAILVTGKCEEMERVIKVIKMGVIDFIPKPLNSRNLSHLEISIRTSVAGSHRERNNQSAEGRGELNRIVGKSKKMQEVRDLILMYANSDASVLLLGESGVGKNLVAETIHKLSKRKNSTYKSVHTAAIPPTLIESELYGTNAGAFTDAKPRPGHFELAAKGTLFLDEIGEMTLSAQVKLLRILEEKTITRLGGTRSIPIDVRVISATNTELSRAVKNKTFRQDLYYRINTLIIEIPPLRERMEDIPILVDYFLKNKNSQYTMTAAGLEKLLNHPWPGNIRELQNTLTRSCIHSGRENRIKRCHINFL